MPRGYVRGHLGLPRGKGDTILRGGARGGVLIEGWPQVGGLLEGLQSFFVQPIATRTSHLASM